MDDERHWSEIARGHKQLWCGDADNDPEETPSLLVVEAAGNPLAVVFLLVPDRDRMIRLIATAVYGLIPDRIVLAADAMMAIRPVESRAEIEAAYRAGGRPIEDASDAMQAMQAMRVDRAGRVQTRLMPYRRVGRRIDWDEPIDVPPGDAEGFFPENLARIMTRRDHVLTPRGPDGRRQVDHDTLAKARRACLGWLEDRGLPVLRLDPMLAREDQGQGREGRR